MHSQPLPTIPLPPGESGEALLEQQKREDLSESINLDLEIGRSSREAKRKFKDKDSIFTASQFHEFFEQVLVYNYIISVTGLIFDKWDHSCAMDPEPGRCRRTDGRKWRCSRSVVPNEKYCERHMHRGRQGSRKHVEATGSDPNNRSKHSNDHRMPTIPYIMHTREGDFNLTNQCWSYCNCVPPIVNCRSTEDQMASWATHKEVNKKENAGRASIDSELVKGVSYAVGKNSEFDTVNSTKSSRRKRSVTKSNYMGLVPPRFGLSPKSVLHCGAGKVDLSLGSKTVVETERQRCRRTDGKKWQCRQDAISGEKYCEAHMHRGVKRLIPNPECIGNNDAPAATSHVSSSISKCIDNGINLNTIPASPEHITGDNNNPSSSASDATTVTDENISFCLNASVRKC